MKVKLFRLAAIVLMSTIVVFGQTDTGGGADNKDQSAILEAQAKGYVVLYKYVNPSMKKEVYLDS